MLHQKNCPPKQCINIESAIMQQYEELQLSTADGAPVVESGEVGI